MRIDGIVERTATTSRGHRLGLNLIIEGRNEIFHFNATDEAYDKAVPFEGEALAELTQAGDHVWFEVKDGQRIGRPGTLRNWTLEHRLYGQEKPLPDEVARIGAEAKRLTQS